MKKIISAILLLVILSLSLCSCSTLQKVFNTDKDDDYLLLRSMMMFEKLDFMPVSNHLLSIKNILDRLPDSYKDVKQIREDYIYINSKFELLMNQNLPIETMHSAAMSLLNKMSNAKIGISNQQYMT